MLIKYLKSYFSFGNRFCGIEHTTKTDNEIIYVNILKKSRNNVDIDNSFSSKTIQNVIKSLAKNQHVFLIINNEHILTKVVDNETFNDDLKLVHKVFPNINISEFYYEIIKQGTKYFISICRSTYIDNLIKDYSKLGISVINFSLGNSIISNTIHYIKSPSIQTSNALISNNNGFITSIEYNEEKNKKEYYVNGIDINSSYILSLSGSLSNILKDYNPNSNFENKKKQLLNAFLQLRFFSQFLKTGLIFIVSLLLINFLFFNYYFNKVNTLNETSQLQQTTKNKILKLNEHVIKAKNMTDEMLKSSVSKSSYFIDKIVNSLPESILLSEINYQPLSSKIKTNKFIALEPNIIIISGESNNSSLYSKWISSIEHIEWVTSVEVINYNDLKTSTSQFSIKIDINDQ